MIAYFCSFFLIYLSWRMHHDIFKVSKVVNIRSFLCNGLWIFFLTLVPFTTGWVGKAPHSIVPAFVYPLNLLLWNLAFHLLSYRLRKDNPDVESIPRGFTVNRVIMYIGYAASMAIAFVKPIWSIRIVGLITLLLILRLIYSKKNID